MADREQTLGELVEQLPENHRARLEYEEARRLPDELRTLIAQQTWGAAQDAFEISAKKVEAALASAPAVPGKYGEHANDVVADSNWSAGARFGWNCAIVGDKDRLERAIQSRVDERAAAAPQRGGEK